MKKYCAIIADIIKSREMDTSYRIKVQNTLIKKIKEFNKLYEEQLAAYIDIASGDQIQALFNNCEDAYNFICFFRSEMYPVLFRYGIGYGNWDVRITSETLKEKASSNLQDGSAYHFARSALEKAEKNAHSQIIFYSGIETDAYINVFIANEERIFHEQTEIQKQLSHIYNDLYPLNPQLSSDDSNIPIISFTNGIQSTIAKQMNTTPQNISQNIKRGLIIYQREIQSAINIMMKSGI